MKYGKFQPPKLKWGAGLNLLWKAKIADDESDIYEDNIQHAISCKCCSPLHECEKNDIDRENQRLHNTGNKAKCSDVNILCKLIFEK